MLGMTLLILGLIAAAMLVAFSFKVPERSQKLLCRVAALVLVVLGLAVSSAVYVPSDRVGIISKNWLGRELKDGKILAVNGEMGPQADVLAPGLHFGYWPFVYSMSNQPLTIVDSGKVGIVETTDGLPMDAGQLFAGEWSQTEFQQMLDARYFLTTGKGRKGKQVSVLTPGTYRLNPLLYKVKMVDQTEVLQGEVGVVKSNFGAPSSELVDAQTGRTLTTEEANALPQERVLSFCEEW